MTPKFYIVGGAVRDSLLCREITDIDYLVVGATPDWMLSNGYCQVGADFPVFIKDGEEYALARTERKTGMGHLGFTTNCDTSVTVTEDLQRRDITINSMAVDVDNWERFIHLCSISPVSAMEQYVIGATDDIFNEVISANHNSFIEDPLRVLRAIRFAATLPSSKHEGSWTIADDTLTMMQFMVDGADFKEISKERIVQEVFKTADKCSNVGQFMTFLEFLNYLASTHTLFSEIYHIVELPDVTVDRTVSHSEAVALLMLSRVGTIKDGSIALMNQKYPSTCIDYAATTAYVYDHFVMSDVVTVEKLVETMEAISRHHYHNVIDFMDSLGLFVNRHHQLESLNCAYDAWNTINFSDLPTHLRTRLSGKDVGQAIKQLRTIHIDNYLRRK